MRGERESLPKTTSSGRLCFMSSALRDVLLRLPAAERLELIEELWDSIEDDDPALELTPEHRADLGKRVAEADANPTGGSPWEEARERIRQRRR